MGTFIPITNFADLKNIHFSLQKNDVLVQSGCSGDMIFFFDEIIHYISQYITLKTGDVIFTGTPKGIGKVEKGDYLDAFLENEKLLHKKIL